MHIVEFVRCKDNEELKGTKGGGCLQILEFPQMICHRPAPNAQYTLSACHCPTPTSWSREGGPPHLVSLCGLRASGPKAR